MKKSIKGSILEVFEENPNKTFLALDLVEQLNLKEDSIRDALRKLENADAITVIREGRGVMYMHKEAVLYSSSVKCLNNFIASSYFNRVRHLTSFEKRV